MRVCITGVGGFAGSFLAELLIHEGNEVHGVLSIRNDRSNLVNIENQIILYPTDLCDPHATVELLGTIRPDCIFLLAADAVPSQSFGRVREVLSTNSLITINIYEALRMTGLKPRLLCVSSVDVYKTTAGDVLDENSKIGPLNPYAISKHVQELLCQYYGHVHALQSIIVRPFAFTGPRQKPCFAIPSFARQIARIEQGEQVPMIEVGNINVVRDYSDVRDIVRGFVAALDHGKEAEVYNLCSGRGITLHEILETLIGCTNVPVRIKRNEARIRPIDPINILGDRSKTFREIEWAPTIPLETTLKDTLNYWRTITHQEKGERSGNRST